MEGVTGGAQQGGVAAGVQMTEDMRWCIEHCTNCHRICLETIAYCLAMGGTHAEANHIRLLMDCAEICRTSADFMIRRSEFYGRTCAACADVCAACTEDCRSLGSGDQQMTVCAEMCERCAESCRQMATGARS